MATLNVFSPPSRWRFSLSLFLFLFSLVPPSFLQRIWQPQRSGNSRKWGPGKQRLSEMFPEFGSSWSLTIVSCFVPVSFWGRKQKLSSHGRLFRELTQSGTLNLVRERVICVSDVSLSSNETFHSCFVPVPWFRSICGLWQIRLHFCG